MQLRNDTILNNGRYEIKSCIGDGGFGITYLARDKKLEREVVLKEYFPDYMARRDTTVSNDVQTIDQSHHDELHTGITKFMKEAKILALLDDIQAIATVHDFFEENNTAYIVMEYIKGKNLKQYIRERQTPYTFKEAMAILEPCMLALQKVHEAGIIHRDFAPDNIIINNKNQVKIIDFGASRDYVSNNATMTVMVKHGYAPLEQYSNAVKQGPYTDVYSLAAILYEMLTLHKPMPSIDRVIADKLPVPSSVNPTVTETQDEAVMKGLVVVFSSRYQNVKEFYDALKESENSNNVIQGKSQPFEKFEAVKAADDKNPGYDNNPGYDKSAVYENYEATEIITGNQIYEEQPKKKTSKAKKTNKAKKILTIVAAALAILAIASVAFIKINGSSKTVEPNDNFSECLDGAGYVQGVTAKNIVTLPVDYTFITVPYSEIAYTDDDFERYKTSTIENYRILDTEITKKIEYGDEINLDYSGTIDGVAFEGGSTNGGGHHLEIGSGTFIPGFEDQLVGHQIGDVFDITVTFPEDYTADNLAGKESVFNIIINGIYVEPEFDDTFVYNHFSDVATTVEEYKAYLKEQKEEEAKRKYVEKYIYDNSTLSKYPKDYLKQLKGNLKYKDMKACEYMNQMYALYGIQEESSFEEFIQMSEEEYDALLDEQCKKQEVLILAIQAICEMQRIIATENDITEYRDTMVEDEYQISPDEYGRNYIAQLVLREKAIDYLAANAIVK